MATVDELREKYGDKIADEFAEALQPEWYRKDIAEHAGAKKRADDLQRELDGMKRVPDLRAAFKEAGLDVEARNEDGSYKHPAFVRNIVEGYEGELEPEKISAFIQENELPAGQAGTGESQARDIVNHATAAPATGGSRTTLTPEVVSQWSTEKLLDLQKKDPDAFEALKRGESVVATAV